MQELDNDEPSPASKEGSDLSEALRSGEVPLHTVEWLQRPIKPVLPLRCARCHQVCLSTCG